MAMCPIFAFLILGSYPLTCPGCVELYLCKEFMNCKMDEQKNTRLSPLSTTSLCMCLSVFHVFGDYYVLFPVIASWSSFRLSLLPLFYIYWSIYASFVHPSIEYFSVRPPMHVLPIHPCIYSSIYLSIHVYRCSQLASGTELSWPKGSRYHCIPYVMGGGWELFIRIRLVAAPATDIMTLP